MSEHSPSPSHEEVLGPFRMLFERNELKVAGYLKLLNLLHPVAVRQVRDALASDRALEYIRRFLGEANWRPNLVAAVAVLLLPDRAGFASELWTAFDRPSWVAPQLAVTLKFVDPDFVAQARRRIEQYATFTFDQILRHAKGFESLVYVLSATPDSEGWLAEHCPASLHAELKRADDRNNSCAKAQGWEAVLRGQSNLLG